jgi:rapamycin-insensitive companion of mTOR
LGPATWALELLVTQLYDTSPLVAEVAAQQLERACESLEVLQIVVNMQPTLDHLGDVGQPLLMRYVGNLRRRKAADIRLRFLSTSIGFSYLVEADYIDQEMDEWFLVRTFRRPA